jgi:hypothetical protein
MYFVSSVFVFCWGMHIQSSDVTVTSRIPCGLAATAYWIQKQLPSKLYINSTRISVRNPESLRKLDGMHCWLRVKARFCHLPVDSCDESLNLIFRWWLTREEICDPTAHAASYPTVPGVFSRGRVKQQGNEADHSPPSCAEAKKSGAIPPLPHTSSWYNAWLIEHRGNVTLLHYNK